MRAVDADEVVTRAQAKINGEERLTAWQVCYSTGFNDAIEMIKNAPTLETISIEWMRAQEDAQQRGSAEWWIIKALIEKWRREQGFR